MRSESDCQDWGQVIQDSFKHPRLVEKDRAGVPTGKGPVGEQLFVLVRSGEPGAGGANIHGDCMGVGRAVVGGCTLGEVYS